MIYDYDIDDRVLTILQAMQLAYEYLHQSKSLLYFVSSVFNKRWNDKISDKFLRTRDSNELDDEMRKVTGKQARNGLTIDS